MLLYGYDTAMTSEEHDVPKRTRALEGAFFASQGEVIVLIEETIERTERTRALIAEIDILLAKRPSCRHRAGEGRPTTPGLSGSTS
jgi:hypothetical protein